MTGVEDSLCTRLVQAGARYESNEGCALINTASDGDNFT